MQIAVGKLSDYSKGLSASEARSRLARDGANDLPVSGQRGALRLIRDVSASRCSCC